MDIIFLLQRQFFGVFYKFGSNSIVFIKWGSETLIGTNYQFNSHLGQLYLLSHM